MTEKPAEEKTCSICQGRYTGFGNNARPVNDGRCCDDCNTTVVIPARLQMIARHQMDRS